MSRILSTGGGGGRRRGCLVPEESAAGVEFALGGGMPGPGGGGSAPRGGLLWGVCSGGVCSRGVAGGDPPGRSLQRAVRILLECILVCGKFGVGSSLLRITHESN